MDDRHIEYIGIGIPTEPQPTIPHPFFEPREGWSDLWREAHQSTHFPFLDRLASDIARELPHITECITTVDVHNTPDMELVRQGLNEVLTYRIASLNTHHQGLVSDESFQEITREVESLIERVSADTHESVVQWSRRVQQGNGSSYEETLLSFVLIGHYRNSDNTSTFGNVEFIRQSPQNMRDRIEWITQQGAKYDINPQTTDVPRLLLLHTKPHGEKNTRYEHIQERNLEAARQWAIEELGTKPAPINLEDIATISEYLLQDLVPKGAERNFRTHLASRQRKIQYSDTPRDDMEQFLVDVFDDSRMLQSRPEAVDIMSIARTLAFWRTCADGIHLLEEANGRLGSVLLDVWSYQLLRKRFYSPRNADTAYANGILTMLQAVSHPIGRDEVYFDYGIAREKWIEDTQKSFIHRSFPADTFAYFIVSNLSESDTIKHFNNSYNTPAF